MLKTPAALQPSSTPRTGSGNDIAALARQLAADHSPVIVDTAGFRAPSTPDHSTQVHQHNSGGDLRSE